MTIKREFVGFHGLYKATLHTGKQYWRLKYRFNGKEQTLSLGQYPSTNEEAAKTKTLVARESIKNGINPADIKSYANKIRGEKYLMKNENQATQLSGTEEKPANFGLINIGDLLKEFSYAKGVAQIDFLRQFGIAPTFSKRCAKGFQEFITPDEAAKIRVFLIEKTKVHTTNQLSKPESGPSTPDGVAFAAILQEITELKTMVAALNKAWS